MPGTVNEPLSFAEIFSLILVLLGVAAAVRDAAQAWRQDRGAVLKTLPLMAVYLVYGATGIYVTVRLLDGPQPSDRAAALTAFLVAWILFGIVWLMRIIPRTGPLPAWIGERFGFADFVLLLTGSAGLGYFVFRGVL